MGKLRLTDLKRLAYSLLSNRVLTGSAVAMIIKFASALMGFVMFALAARQMQTAEFGSLAVIFNAMSFLSVALVFGQETLISRSWGEYCGASQPALARGALAFGAWITAMAAFASAILLVAGWYIWGAPAEEPWLPLAAGLFLFTQTLMTFNGRFTLVAAGLFSSELPREVFWRLVVIIMIAVLGAKGISVTASDFFFTAGGVLLVSLLYQCWRLSCVIPEAVKRAKAEFATRLWCRRSLGMWLSSLLDSSSQYVEVLVIAFFLGPVTAAFYFSATRITNVFAMIASGVTTYATTHISSLFHANARDELQSLLRALALMGTLLCIGAFGAIVVLGHLLLSFYGPLYAEIYPALIVLAAGASLTGLAGPAPYLLLLTGHERLYPRVIGAGLLIRLTLIAVLGTWFGLMGAAIGGSLAVALTSIALVIACRRAIQLDPSFLSALKRANRAELWLKAGLPNEPA